jgi:hypothetical protein
MKHCDQPLRLAMGTLLCGPTKVASGASALHVPCTHACCAVHTVPSLAP